MLRALGALANPGPDHRDGQSTEPTAVTDVRVQLDRSRAERRAGRHSGNGGRRDRAEPDVVAVGLEHTGGSQLVDQLAVTVPPPRRRTGPGRR